MDHMRISGTERCEVIKKPKGKIIKQPNIT